MKGYERRVKESMHCIFILIATQNSAFGHKSLCVVVVVAIFSIESVCAKLVVVVVKSKFYLTRKGNFWPFYFLSS